MSDPDDVTILDYPYLVTSRNPVIVYAVSSPYILPVLELAIKVASEIKPVCDMGMVARGMGCERVYLPVELIESLLKKAVSPPPEHRPFPAARDFIDAARDGGAWDHG